MEAGFSQSDVATWAYTGTGVFEGKPKVDGPAPDRQPLSRRASTSWSRRAPASRRVADLKGKRVSLDEPGSGTLVDARMVLAAYGVKEKDIKPEYIKPDQAGDKLKDGSLDAFFFVGGCAGRRASPNSPPAAPASNCCPLGGAAGAGAAASPALVRQGPHPRRHLQGRRPRSRRSRSARSW